VGHPAATASSVLRALIADDEAGARWHLCALLEACQVRTVGECTTGAEVLAALDSTRPDLLCLDVRLPDIDGIEVARRSRLVGDGHVGARPAVVFTTGYPDYAAPAFEVDVADYLVKPLAAARVEQAVRRVRARLQRFDGAPAYAPAAPELPPPRLASIPRIFIPAADHHLALAPDAIRFIEARDGGSLVHGDDGTHRLQATLDRLERLLTPFGFLRTHRAYLVNLHRVRALVPWSRHVHSLLLDGGKETHVPVAKSRLAAFRRSVIWISQTGASPHGPGTAGQGRDRSRRQPGTGPRDRGGTGG
jgi:DNA-binding LytR/AlgR family response regulator